jgi:hypothetical protein
MLKKTLNNIGRDERFNGSKTGILLSKTNISLLGNKKSSYSQTIDTALRNYFTYSLTMYIIVHRISNNFHIGYFEGDEPHDLNWHYANSTGSGTLGDQLRREGFSRYSVDIIGKFGNVHHLARNFRMYKKILSRKGEAYKSHLDNDDIEVLLRTYNKKNRK